MNSIPEEFQIKELVRQDTYLVNGELKNGQGKLLRFFLLFLLPKSMHLLC